MHTWIQRTLGRQILFGYTVVCGLFFLFGLYAYQSIYTVARHMEHMGQQLSRSVTLSMEIAHDVSMLRQHALGYARTHKQDDLNDFDQTSRHLEEKIQQTREALTSPKHRSAVEHIEKSAAQYEQVFENMVRNIEDTQGLILKDMNYHKDLVEDGLSALRIWLISFEDTAAVLLLEGMARTFLELQLNGHQFIETGDEKYFLVLDRVRVGAVPQMAALRDRLPENKKEILDTVAANFQAFAQILEKIRHHTRMLFKHLNELMRLEAAVREEVASLRTSLTATIQAYQLESRRISARTGLLVLIYAVLTVVGGLILGFLHTRRITHPLRRVMTTSQNIASKDIQCLIDQLRRLARGELKVDFTVTAEPMHLLRLDEVGVTASACDQVIGQLQEAQEAFQEMRRYLEHTAATAHQVAAGKLDLDVNMASEKDVMGKALQKMLTSLRDAEEEVMRHRQCLEKQVEQKTRELEENRRMLRTLLGNLQGMAYRCRNDPSWTMEFVSEGVIALTGYRPEDLVGNQTISYGDLVHPDDRDAVYQAVQESLSQRHPFILLYRIRTKDDEEKWVWEKGRGIWSENGTLVALEGFITDFTVLKRLHQEREQLIEDLQKALSEVKTLSGLLPICSSCKKIRNDQGYWEQLENYFRKHSDILFTHGICPECMKKLYPDVYEKMQRKKAQNDT